MTEVLDKLLAGDAGIAALAGVAVTLLIAIVAGSWQLYKHFSDRTAMRKHRTPFEKEFPERGYRQWLDLFCDALLSDLDRLDEQANWWHRQFVPLDAEVDLLRGVPKRRRVMDLFAGIKANRRSRLFLLIGDPGSGKSVALRKLCRELLRKVHRTGEVPLYVNLREWLPNVPWSKEGPPTEQQLRAFILQNLKERLPDPTHRFLDTYFLPMLDDGRLFLLLDSFDEIPAVMDADERSWLVMQLS